MEFTWIPAKSYRRRRTLPIESIILHSTDGHEAGDIETLTQGEVSVHWYVTRSGKVYHFVQDSDTAYHAGEVCHPMYSNAASVGIEQEHIDGKQDWPDAQVKAVAQLIVELRAKHGRNLPVVSHSHAAFPRGRKQDPVGYPWRKLTQFASLTKPTGLAQS